MRRRMRAARGYSLIETMLLIAGLSMILGLVIVTAQILLRAEQSARAERQQFQALGHIAARFRRDAHEALGADPPAEFQAVAGVPARLRFQGSAGRWVEYRVTEGALEVERSVDADRPAVETYRLPKAGVPAVALEPRDGRLVAVLSWTDADGRPGAGWEVAAEVGRDQRVLEREGALP